MAKLRIKLIAQFLNAFYDPWLILVYQINHMILKFTIVLREMMLDPFALESHILYI